MKNFDEAKLARLDEMYQRHVQAWEEENDQPHDQGWWRYKKFTHRVPRSNGIKVHKRAGYRTARKAKAK